MEIRLLKTTKITVFEFESDSATDPQFYKVVWTNPPLREDDLLFHYDIDLWYSQFGGEFCEWKRLCNTLSQIGIVSANHSIELLNRYLKYLNPPTNK